MLILSLCGDADADSTYSCLGKMDAKLGKQAKPMLDVLRVLVHTYVQLITDRVNNVHKVLNNPLRKEVIKRKTDKYGDKELPTEHLLGEDLGERNKKVLKRIRASDTVWNTSLAPKKWRRSGKAEQIINHFHNWSNLTSDIWILAYVRGYKIPFLEEPIQHRIPTPFMLTS